MREKPRLVDKGPFAYIRHPLYAQVFLFAVCWVVFLMIFVYSGHLIAGASLALAFWSYIPLYALPVAFGAYLLKVPIEVRDPVDFHAEVALTEEHSRRELSCRIRNSVTNIGHTKTRFPIGLFHTSGEIPQRIPDTGWIESYIRVSLLLSCPYPESVLDVIEVVSLLVPLLGYKSVPVVV